MSKFCYHMVIFSFVKLYVFVSMFYGVRSHFFIWTRLGFSESRECWSCNFTQKPEFDLRIKIWPQKQYLTSESNLTSESKFDLRIKNWPQNQGIKIWTQSQNVPSEWKYDLWISIWLQNQNLTAAWKFDLNFKVRICYHIVIFTFV